MTAEKYSGNPFGLPSGLNLCHVRDWVHSDPAPQPWLIQNLIPIGDVTLIGGDGGIGKSYLLLQLMFAMATQDRWLGMYVTPGHSMGFFAEDTTAALHRRLLNISSLYHTPLDDSIADRMVLHCGRDKDNVLSWCNDRRTGDLMPTDMWFDLVESFVMAKRKLLILDNLADVYSGDEIDRRQVRSFVKALAVIASQNDCAIVINAHPSRAGLKDEDGLSGSTAWHNSVRSRIYVYREKSRQGVLRVKHLKNNHGPLTPAFDIQWTGSGFSLVEDLEQYR